MEDLKTILKSEALFSYACEGKVFYTIQTEKHTYQLELNSNSDDWKATYLLPSFKALNLMRWIRKGIEKEDNTFILLK